MKFRFGMTITFYSILSNMTFIALNLHQKIDSKVQQTSNEKVKECLPQFYAL